MYFRLMVLGLLINNFSPLYSQILSAIVGGVKHSAGSTITLLNTTACNTVFTCTIPATTAGSVLVLAIGIPNATSTITLVLTNNSDVGT